jgi:hypothetical protein
MLECGKVGSSPFLDIIYPIQVSNLSFVQFLILTYRIEPPIFPGLAVSPAGPPDAVGQHVVFELIHFLPPHINKIRL